MLDILAINPLKSNSFSSSLEWMMCIGIKGKIGEKTQIQGHLIEFPMPISHSREEKVSIGKRQTTLAEHIILPPNHTKLNTDFRLMLLAKLL